MISHLSLLWDVRIRLMLCVETRRVTGHLSSCRPMLHCIETAAQTIGVSRHIACLMGREQGDLEKSGKLGSAAMFSLGLDIFWRSPEMWCLQDCCVRLRLLAKFERKEGNPTQYVWHS